MSGDGVCLWKYYIGRANWIQILSWYVASLSSWMHFRTSCCRYYVVLVIKWHLLEAQWCVFLMLWVLKTAKVFIYIRACISSVCIVGHPGTSSACCPADGQCPDWSTPCCFHPDSLTRHTAWFHVTEDDHYHKSILQVTFRLNVVS